MGLRAQCAANNEPQKTTVTCGKRMRETTNLRPSGQAVFLHSDRYALSEPDGAAKKSASSGTFFVVALGAMTPTLGEFISQILRE